MADYLHISNELKTLACEEGRGSVISLADDHSGSKGVGRCSH